MQGVADGRKEWDRKGDENREMQGRQMCTQRRGTQGAGRGEGNTQRDGEAVRHGDGKRRHGG